MNGMNILVTLNAGYLPQLEVMLFSLLRQQRGRPVTVYVANSSLTQEQLDQVSRKLACPHCTLVDTKAPAHLFEGAPITSRYPKEMYYRIFAGQLLPRQVERILRCLREGGADAGTAVPADGAAASAGLNADVPLLLGITLISALFVCVGNTIANLLYGVIDPQIREVAA